MTTKEEVLRIVKEAGFDMAIFDIRRDLMTVRLIELAKQAGAEEERTLSYEREKEIVRLACLSAADQARDHQKEIEAIRNRESKS